MLLTLCCVVVTGALSGLCYVVLNSKKSMSHILKEVSYEVSMQRIGFHNVVDDFLRRRHNVLGEDLVSRQGGVAVITGGARGIGVEVVKGLLERGVRVVMGVRMPAAGIKMADKLKQKGYAGIVDVFELDVASLKSVESFAKIVTNKYPKIDLLINNAGIMFGDYKLTVDGFESQLATNYLGHFYLTHFLLPNLKRAGGDSDVCSRVVNVSSCAHLTGEIFFEDINMKMEYFTAGAYAQSKLAQIMFARFLNRSLEQEGSPVCCFSVHPGVVNTDLFQNSSVGRYAPWLQRMLFKTPRQGAVSILYACLSPKLEKRGGLYVSNCRRGKTSGWCDDEEKQKKLFDVSCQMVKIEKYGEVQ